MHKLHQTSKWTHGTVVALYRVSWARTNNIAQNPLPYMIPVSVGHGDNFVRFVGTSEAAAMLFFIWKSRAESSGASVDHAQCILSIHPPSASPASHVCLAL